MRPVYYISKVKNDVEQTWHDIEQLVWTLVYATKRLKYYFIFKPFVVLTSCSLLPHALKYPGDNAKLQKWLLNLQLFDMSFIKEDSVRENMADMLTFKEINVTNDMKKDLEMKIVPSSTMHEELQEVEGTLYFDGAFKRSINKGAVGYVFFDKNGIEGWFGSQEVDVSSNNEAEYASLCVGLNKCIKRHVKKLLIKGDSMLVINQIQVTIKEPRYLGRESLCEEEHVLQTGFARKGLSPQQRHAITRRAMKYVITGEHLYHKGVDGVMRRVLYQDEVFDCLKACHEEGCGGHFGVKITRNKVLDAHLMWPSMNRDVVHWCKSCHECQVYQKRKLMPEPLKGIVSYGPFEKWGVDVIGPLRGTRNGKHYILSAVDYMRKWPEAKASRGATSKDVCNFIFDCICCRFGVSLELVSDQGKEFRNDLIQDLVKNLEIKHRYSTPYHPQCNGLVEAFNGVLQKILFKLVEEHPKDWDMCLERALWACNVTQNIATGFTPFHLVYGERCVMPINVMIPSLEFILKHNLIEEEQMKERVASMHTLLLDRENAIKYYENMSQKRADVFSNKIKAKEICKGMLVMRYNSTLDTTFPNKV
ncbi:hypothetical protein L7F22_026641 [Adiantum nelumboides]|nr:hypothetical protein [Adiantum nelumboides]